jgi:hypothetical protein
MLVFRTDVLILFLLRRRVVFVFVFVSPAAPFASDVSSEARSTTTSAFGGGSGASADFFGSVRPKPWCGGGGKGRNFPVVGGGSALGGAGFFVA